MDKLFDFGHLEPVGTIDHTLVGVHIPPSNPEPVVLELRHAGEGNERYMKAVKNASAKGKASEQVVVSIFAKTVVSGWRNVKMIDGRDVPFSPAAIEEMLLRLLDAKRGDIVSRALSRAAETDRFVAGADELGKE